MAEPTNKVSKALKKLADQLDCPKCLRSYTDPKLLQCFHVFCKDCLEPLVLRDKHELSLRCPTCLCSTLLAKSGVSGLQAAFHIHHMFDIQEVLRKVQQGQEGQKIRCEKCKKKGEANGFCRDCGKFVCEVCIEMHETWEDFAAHEVISLEQLRSDALEMVPPMKKTLYCSKHPEKELDLFCETDQELICMYCVVNSHQSHQYNLINEAFPIHRYAITTNVKPAMLQLNTVNKAIYDLVVTQEKIMEQRAAVEVDIRHKIRQLQESLKLLEVNLISQLDQMILQKSKTLSIQRAELEILQIQLSGSVEFVSNSLKTCSNDEILVVEKSIVLQATKLCTEFSLEILHPRQLADMVLVADMKLLSGCISLGQIYSSQVCPFKCFATDKGLEVTTVGKQSTVTVHAMNREDKECDVPFSDAMLSCELVSCSNGEKMKCQVFSEGNNYKIHHQPTQKGYHELHIKVADQHIKGSPFKVIVLKKFETPIRTINSISFPAGVAINEKGQLMIAERDSHCISIYTALGEKVRSFGLKGSAPGQLKHPCGIAVDSVGNILVAEADNHRIQKFTAEGKFVTSVDMKGIKSHSWNDPPSISINPQDKVYVCDNAKPEIQILNPDLSLHTTFGCEQLSHPWDLAFDSRGNVYVADFGHSNAIHVFTEDGHYIRRFGTKGEGDEKLTSTAGITIDSNDIVYITEKDENRVSLYTTEGSFLRSFGMRGKFIWLDKPRGIAVDKDGLVYICDSGNSRLLVW